MIYQLKSNKDTLHGFLSSSLKPVLEIESGDTVLFQTLEADWRIHDTNIRSSIEGDFFPDRTSLDTGHALCGPVFIKGLLPGQTLAVTIKSLHCGTWGWSRFGGGDPEHLKRSGFSGEEYFLHWKINTTEKICTSHLGHSISLKPFMGVYAVAPPSSEIVSTHIPAAYGGNLDCKEIGEGATLYLPVFETGGLFSTGDGHAAQGDGELSGTAIEAPMECAAMQFHIRDWPLQYPVCETASEWFNFGFDSDLTTGTYLALQNMGQLMCQLFKMTYKEAIALASLIVDLRITQIVNGIKGVHAVLPKKAVRKWDSD